MMRRRNGEPAGNNGHADGVGPDAALMGFHGTNDAGGAHSSPSRTSDGGFSAVSGGPLHLASHGTASTNNGGGNAHHHPHQHHQPNKLYVSSPAPAPAQGVGLSGSGYRGGGLVEEMGDRTPLFGAPPAGAGFDARYARHGNGSSSSSVSALHSARSRDRRRMMGRLAVRATQPAALMMLAGVALLMMMTTTSWSGGAGSGGGAVSAGTPAAGTTGKVLAATAATASGGAAEMLAEAAVDVLSQAAAFGSTADGTSASTSTRTSTSGHGNIKVVQPEHLGSASDGIADLAAPASAAAAEAAPISAAATTSVDSPAKGDAGVLWLLDKDGNKKVILIPRDSDKKKAAAGTATTTSSNPQAATKLQQKQSLLQKLGLTRKKHHKKQQKQQQQKATEGTPAAATAADASSASDVVTYYYDSVVPQTAMTSTGAASTAASTGTGPGQEPPMAAVPEVVYDKMGNAVKLVDLHNVGSTAASLSTAEQNSPVLASPADDAINAVADALPSNANAAAKVPKTSPTAKTTAAEVNGAALTSPATAATAAVAATKSMANTLAGASSLEAEGTTNQLIVIATVATMALFGGALVARRMRTRNFLNSCIENESLEDELAYDAANTTLGAAVGYDTFSAVGDMKWKGDLEKFDV